MPSVDPITSVRHEHARLRNDRSPAPASATSEVASRRTRLRLAAAARGVPLPTILVTVAVVVVTYLLGRLAYRLRGILLLIVIASFASLVLNPFVVTLQQWRLRRRGRAVAVVVVAVVAVFLGLTAAFGYPLSNGLKHLARDAPSYVSAAGHGHGPVGRLIQHFHLQRWVSDNAPKLQQLGMSLAKPALTFGKGAVVIVGQLLGVFTMVVLFLLEGPRMRAGVLSLMSEEHGTWCMRRTLAARVIVA